MIVVRTGTAVRPRPGSSAMRTPAAAGTESPTSDTAATTRDGRTVDASLAARPARCASAGQAASSKHDRRGRGEPDGEDRPRDVEARIGLGGPRDADRGQRRRQHRDDDGDGRTDERDHRRRAASRLRTAVPASHPRARSASLSFASRKVWRASACPMTSRPVSAITTAKTVQRAHRRPHRRVRPSWWSAVGLEHERIGWLRVRAGNELLGLGAELRNVAGTVPQADDLTPERDADRPGSDRGTRA